MWLLGRYRITLTVAPAVGHAVATVCQITLGDP